MLDESLRRRLEALNRDRLPAAAFKPKPRPPAPPARQPARPSGGLFASAKVCEDPAGEHLVITAPVDQFWEGGERLVASRLEHLRSSPQPAPYVAAMPGGSLLLDLETCGLGGAALFLIGLLRQIDGRLTVELLLAKHYGQERAILAALWRRLEHAEVLLTYNGKSFDWPTVVDRSRRHLLHKENDLREPHHVDVLHAARRRWKESLPDCKLQTIERLVCRRARVGDIPGKQIPAAYDAFVRTGDPREMEAVLYHNALDLVTLLDIAMRVAE